MRLAAALVIGLGAVAALAAPGEAPDAITRLLAEQALATYGATSDATAPAVSAAPGSTVASNSPTAPLAPIAPAEPNVVRRVQDRAGEMATAALAFVGVRYRRGGTSADTGFDCSGFVRFLFETGIGRVLPRRADEQAAAPGLVAIRRDDLQPGDLVFFNTLRRAFSHVGIYLGANRFIHAPRSGQQVRTEDMSFAYWASRYNGARRVPATQGPAAATAATAASPVAPEGVAAPAAITSPQKY